MKTPSLKDSLTRWTGFPKIESKFRPVHVLRAAIQVERQFADVTPRTPPRYDLEILYRRVVESWSRNHSLDRIESRDLRRLP